jgi:spore coat protein CotH
MKKLSVVPALLVLCSMALAISAEEPPSFGGDANELFAPDRIETYEVFIEPTVLEWQRLNARKEKYVPARLRFRGREWENVAMRFKGDNTLNRCFNWEERQTCPKLSIKLRFDRFEPRGRFYGLRRINFNSMVRDPSLIREHLAYALYREAGVPAPRTAFARVLLNGASEGLFLAVEAVDQAFVEHSFPDRGYGSLYKEVWPGCDAESVYRQALRTDEVRGGASRFVEFGQKLRSASEVNWEGELIRWLDLPVLLRYLVVDQAIGNWDGVRGWYCRGTGCDNHKGCGNHNAYWYQESSGQRFHLIPWDLDNTFQLLKGKTLAEAVATPCGPFLVFRDPETASAEACDPLLARLGTLLWRDARGSTPPLHAGAQGEGTGGPHRGRGGRRSQRTWLTGVARGCAEAPAEYPRPA